MSDYHCVNPLMLHRWYTVKVAGLNRELVLSGDPYRYEQPSFDLWFYERDEKSCFLFHGTDKTLYVPKRSILYFSDNGIYRGGDAE